MSSPTSPLSPRVQSREEPFVISLEREPDLDHDFVSDHKTSFTDADPSDQVVEAIAPARHYESISQRIWHSDHVILQGRASSDADEIKFALKKAALFVSKSALFILALAYDFVRALYFVTFGRIKNHMNGRVDADHSLITKWIGKAADTVFSPNHNFAQRVAQDLRGAIRKDKEVRDSGKENRKQPNLVLERGFKEAGNQIAAFIVEESERTGRDIEDIQDTIFQNIEETIYKEYEGQEITCKAEFGVKRYDLPTLILRGFDYPCDVNGKSTNRHRSGILEFANAQAIAREFAEKAIQVLKEGYFPDKALKRLHEQVKENGVDPDIVIKAIQEELKKDPDFKKQTPEEQKETIALVTKMLEQQLPLSSSTNSRKDELQGTGHVEHFPVDPNDDESDVDETDSSVNNLRHQPSNHKKTEADDTLPQGNGSGPTRRSHLRGYPFQPPTPTGILRSRPQPGVAAGNPQATAQADVNPNTESENNGLPASSATNLRQFISQLPNAAPAQPSLSRPASGDSSISATSSQKETRAARKAREKAEKDAANAVKVVEELKKVIDLQKRLDYSHALQTMVEGYGALNDEMKALFEDILQNLSPKDALALMVVKMPDLGNLSFATNSLEIPRESPQNIIDRLGRAEDKPLQRLLVVAQEMRDLENRMQYLIEIIKDLHKKEDKVLRQTIHTEDSKLIERYEGAQKNIQAIRNKENEAIASSETAVHGHKTLLKDVLKNEPVAQA